MSVESLLKEEKCPEIGTKSPNEGFPSSSCKNYEREWKEWKEYDLLDEFLEFIAENHGPVAISFEIDSNIVQPEGRGMYRACSNWSPHFDSFVEKGKNCMLTDKNQRSPIPLINEHRDSFKQSRIFEQAKFDE